MIEEIINNITENTIIYVGKRLPYIDKDKLQADHIVDDYYDIIEADENDKEMLLFVFLCYVYDGGFRCIDERNVRHDYVDDFMSDDLDEPYNVIDYRYILRKEKIKNICSI